MGRQYRPPRRGTSVGAGANALNLPAVVSASSTVTAIPNYGVTDISTFAAGDYVMDAPEAGSRKLICSISSSSAARVIRCATDASVKIGGQGATQIASGQTTLAFAIELLGLNSTQWVVINAYPPASTAGAPTIATS